MRRPVSIITALLISLTLLVIQADQATGSDVVNHAPELGPGTEFTFSYDLQDPEGDVEISGSKTASVTEVEWRGFDCYLFSGTFSETFSTTSGGGTETGTWEEYYRTIDLALLDSSREGEMTIGTDTVQNSTVTSYNAPLRWIEFPLGYSNPKSIWTQSDLSLTSTWERTINNDDQTLTSGSDGETIDLQWVCMNSDSLISKRTDAGSFDTYKIREWVKDDEPRNQTTDYYYSEEAGFWVVKDVFVDHEGSQVRIKHYELSDIVTNDRVVIEEEPTVTMEEDSVDGSVDLDDVFSDPDNDPLDYDLIESGPFEIEIDSDNRLLITPPENAFGSWNITVSATDNINDPVELDIPVTVIAVDDPPVLYEPSHDPDEGLAGDTFTFSIQLMDVDSGSPASARVYIGSKGYDLTRTSGDNESGMELEWTGTLGSGDHSYHFVVDGARYPSSGEIDGPIISNPEEPSISIGTVDLEEGGLSTGFLFEMTWIGPYGEEPEGAYLVMDDIRMELEESSGNPESGLEFEITTALSEGEHEFHFEADLEGTVYRYPDLGEIQGPTVHYPEILDFGYIHLEDQKTSSDYTFFVNYRYRADLDPTSVTVLVDGNEKDMFERTGDALTGINFTRDIEVQEGSHRIEFRIDADGTRISSDEMTLIVDPEYDDDTSDPSGPASTDTDDNGSTTTYIIIGLLVIIIVGGIIFFMMRRKPSDNEERWAEEEDEWEEEP